MVLRMQPLPRRSETKAGRLLCILLLRDRPLSADSTTWKTQWMLRVDSLHTLHRPECGRTTLTILERTFAALLLIAASNATAAWLPISAGSDGTQTTYIAGEAETRSGHIVSASSLQDFSRPQRIDESPEPMHYKSVERQFDYDCANKRFRLTSFTFYAGNMGKGRVVLGDSHTGASEWQAVRKGGLDEALFSHACKQD